MKIVLDTNTLLVSVSGRSPYYPIYQALRNKEYEVLHPNATQGKPGQRYAKAK